MSYDGFTHRRHSARDAPIHIPSVDRRFAFHVRVCKRCKRVDFPAPPGPSSNKEATGSPMCFPMLTSRQNWRMALLGSGCCSKATGHCKPRNTWVGSMVVERTKEERPPTFWMWGTVINACRTQRQPHAPKAQPGVKTRVSNSLEVAWHAHVESPPSTSNVCMFTSLPKCRPNAVAPSSPILLSGHTTQHTHVT